MKTIGSRERFWTTRLRKRRWYRVVTVLSCVVVFCTVYALILPAITLEKCVLPEHTHTESCYTQVTSRTVRTPVCTVTGQVLHVHDDACFDGAGNLWCPLPQQQAHTHGDECYVVHTHSEECYTTTRGELTCILHVHDGGCDQEEKLLSCERHACSEDCYDAEGNSVCEDPHTHDENCYHVTVTRICGEESDHVHTDACYEALRELTCGKEEGERSLICQKQEWIPHTHTDDCYAPDGSLTCGKTELPTHQHTDSCFEITQEPVDTELLTCTNTDETHTHTALCYGTWELTCGMQEHTHGPDCTPEDYFCGQTEHIHTEACRDEAGALTCGQDEHTHTDACRSDPSADTETPEQWEASFAKVTLTGDWRVDLLAIAESQLDYAESKANFRLLPDGSRQGYTRYGAWSGDAYADWCASFVSFCIHYAQVEDMPTNTGVRPWIEALAERELYRSAHPEAETESEPVPPPQPGDLVFFDFDADRLADHVGIVRELLPETEEEPAKLVTIEGNAGDKVCYVTYEQDDPRFLGWATLPEQTFLCGKQGHVHTDRCESCSLEEHIHTADCKFAPAILTAEGTDYTVTVAYGPEAALPGGVTLSVSEITSDSEAYARYLSQAGDAMTQAGQTDKVVFARFFDVRFLLDGEELEPAAPVSVTITYRESVETPDDTNCQTVHFGEAGTELLDTESHRETDGSTSFTHTQEGFSVVGTLLTVPTQTNPADVGPDALTVDYYVCIDGQWVCVGTTKRATYAPEGATGWADTDRDYITLDQVKSILGTYGYGSDGENPVRTIAYKLKTSPNTWSDTNCYQANGVDVLPLSRNADHPGYNVYLLRANTETISGVPVDQLDKTANGFFTVKVYNDQGAKIHEQTVLSGTTFTYDASATGLTSWLAAFADGTTQTITGSTVTLDAVISPVSLSPAPEGTTQSHSVTFKVMVDGQWKTLGSLPYYYSGDVNGSQRDYITSAMAAQFYGPYGYAADQNPGYRFGYSYGNFYTIFYADGGTQTNYCMDIAGGGNPYDGQVVQLYTSNGTTAQQFQVRDAGNGYSYISPIGNSALYLNAYGYASGDPTGIPIKLSSATNENSQWKVDTGSDGRTTFWSAIAPTDQVLNLSGEIKNSGALQLQHSTVGARYWYMVPLYRISNDTASSQNANNTWNIGLTPQSNGDIICYYLPAEEKPIDISQGQPDETSISAANSFWTVSVRDDANTIYSQGELESLIQVIANGTGCKVTVKNVEDCLWSCRGLNGLELTVEENQGTEETVFTLPSINQPVEITLTQADPSFTVQYYAEIPRFATEGDTPLTVIDTSKEGNNGVITLPTNGGTMATRSLYLVQDGGNTDQNVGNATPKYKVKTVIQQTKMYDDTQIKFQPTDESGSSNATVFFYDKLSNNQNYSLKNVGVLKSGKSPDSTNADDWVWYDAVNNSISFTNLASEARDNVILISQGDVLRLVYSASTATFAPDVSFYDYNISSGQNADGRWRTGITGINSKSNYGTSANGQRTWDSTADILAFGNANCGTGMSGYQFDGGELNKYNRTKNPNYKGATFGIAKGLNGDGTIAYNDWIVAPKLFNDGTAIGKQNYSGKMVFSRVGDNYTLTSASVNGASGRGDLEYFFHPSPSTGTTHTHIFTNNFWPMDGANSSERIDQDWGQTTNPDKFQGFTETNNHDWANYAGDLPTGDDGHKHNWFFGLNFAVDFELTEDYVGPLDYYFFGDDDLWVFLSKTDENGNIQNSRLVCDIGGVHSSIGEYVDLRDYLPEGTGGYYRLSLFYTERGASGSTCYMNFTLPSVSSADITTYSDLQLNKQVKTIEGEDLSSNSRFQSEKFKFKVDLFDASNTALVYAVPYRIDTRLSKEVLTTTGYIKSGDTIALQPNQTLRILGLPEGIRYSIQELNTKAYWVSSVVNQGSEIKGDTTGGTMGEKLESVVFINRPYTELPDSGGPGVGLVAGLGLVLMAGSLLGSRKRRRGNGR